MFPDGARAQEFVAQPVAAIAQRAGLVRPEVTRARFLIVEETGVGHAHPFSGDKLSPVLAFYRAADFAAAAAVADSILRHQGAGHSVGLHSTIGARDRARADLPVSRVIVNQATASRPAEASDNALPFSLSMGCGTWGGNSFSDNLNYRHFLNITRVVHPLAPSDVREPTEDELFGEYRARRGA
jgi:sulfoacetaldehyde dehydrogenase